MPPADGESFLIEVRDEKGALLDAAIERAQPRLLLESGTYCGYSALRTARKMRADAHLVSIEYLEAIANIARRILDHDKDLYLPDLRRIVERGWLHPGSVSADNVKFPGAPDYRRYRAAHASRRNLGARPTRGAAHPPTGCYRFATTTWSNFDSAGAIPQPRLRAADVRSSEAAGGLVGEHDSGEV